MVGMAVDRSGETSMVFASSDKDTTGSVGIILLQTLRAVEIGFSYTTFGLTEEVGVGVSVENNCFVDDMSGACERREVVSPANAPAFNKLVDLGENRLS